MEKLSVAQVDSLFEVTFKLSVICSQGNYRTEYLSTRELYQRPVHNTWGIMENKNWNTFFFLVAKTKTDHSGIQLLTFNVSNFVYCKKFYNIKCMHVCYKDLLFLNVV
jgi:hypothetical protein